MAEDTLAAFRTYRADRESLYHPEHGTPLFGSGTDFSLACVCAELSRLAYVRFENGQQGALTAALQAGGLHLVGTMSRSGAQAFVARAADGQIFVAFRGTQSDDPTDLGTDVDIRLQPHAPFPGRVHTGFARSYMLLAAELNAIVAGGDHGPLVLTGHSLGAALATLGATQFRDCRLITFGSPRVGDDGFVRGSLAQSVERYVDCCDLVTEVPPAAIYGYAHMGPMRYVDRTGALHPEDVDGAFVRADRESARVLYTVQNAWHTGNVALRDLADHAPANYIRALV